ncbi:MAG TPA: phosphotransferase, partial [Anaerolineaceae bacterium]|nr:phosphotransferase [Anaerolineaceae bacterium]
METDKFPSRSVMFLPPLAFLVNQVLRKSPRKITLLTNDILTKILRTFDLETHDVLHPLQGAFRNETWVIRTKQGRKVIKRYKESLSRDQIIYEHSILQYLAQNDFPAVRVVLNKDHQTVLEIDHRYYAAFDFLEGYVNYGDYFYIPNQFQKFVRIEGKLLAKLHLVLRSFTPLGSTKYGVNPSTGIRYQGVEFLLENLGRCKEQYRNTPDGKKHPFCKELINHIPILQERLRLIDQVLAETQPLCTIIHGDFRPYNLMISPGKPVTVLDFELAHYDYRLIDLISLLRSSSNIYKRPEDDPAMIEIFKSYQSVYPIPEDELHVFHLVWQWQK